MRTLLLFTFVPVSLFASSVSPVDLKVEHLTNPAALGTTVPRFSWRLEAGEPAARNLRQSACEIQVASDASKLDTPDLWSSGKLATASTSLHAYAGKPLASRSRGVWRVRVWDQDGNQSGWSQPGSFGIGLLEVADWQAQWISAPEEKSEWTSENIQNLRNDPKKGKILVTPAKHFRKEFTPRGKPVRATVHATALGVYTLEINGKRVSDQRLTPGWTNYHKRIHVQSHDAASFLTDGQNVVGATLADGWYAGYVAYGLLTGQAGYDTARLGRNYYGMVPALRVQLELEYADGTREVVATDASWKCSAGPVTEADILMGESYDARKEMPGWSKPGFDDTNWQPAALRAVNGAALQPHPGVPVRPIEEIPAKSVREHSKGVFIFDLGQNISGVVRLKVKGKAGDKVTIRHAEMLHADGRLSTENLRCARAVDTYTLKGDPAGETWTPEFTYHGFQYVELTGFPGTPDKDAVTGIVIHSDTPLTGSFECSDPMLDRLYQNIVWTQRANFFEMPTDCPQRDERMGWTGDAQIYVRAATFNADIAAFYTKWLRDLNDDQWGYGAYPSFAPLPFARAAEQHAAAWMDAGIICPWTIWRVYGDTRVLTEHWHKMERFMEFRHVRDMKKQGTAAGDSNFGDWLSLGDVKTPIEFIDLAYHAYDAALMQEMAGVLGKPDRVKHYSIIARQCRESFQRLYLKPDATLKVHNQSAYAIALFFDLLPADKRAAAAGHLAKLIRDNNNLMTTGFLGTRPLLPVLSANGHHDLAGILMQQKEYPSWGYEVENGATTIWERWNSYIKGKGVHEPSMNSFSHYSFGAVCEWMFSELAGIDLLKPGFDQIRIAPRPTGTITRAKASTVTRHGTVACAWTKENGTFACDITIPPNTSALVTLPAEGQLTESGKPFDDATGGKPFEIGSGKWSFKGKADATPGK